MKRNLTKALVLMALTAIGVSACDDETKVCNSKTETYASISFKWLDTSGRNDVVKDSILPNLTVLALGEDTLYKRVGGYRAITVPLSGLADSSRFYLKATATGVADTITFRYKRVPHFISAGCGFVNYFNIDTIFSTQNEIDSVFINSKQVTTDNATTLTLFF
ncbi:DUF6452 family protein [Chitinophaga horti]|uniref:DUF6452 family protein n=1 Tax=Chitinophaga horti TaxID=2920382 RepID=A0ABY6J0S4_9BACT|nr:DUF6452 family protein [Chitinophaga horti]UYQ92242.1 DUF6452 family protein [Chitinophaga horti]